MGVSLRHWRISISSLAGAGVCCGVFAVLASGSVRFLQLWCVGVIGGFLGYVVGAIWHLWDVRRRTTSSWLAVARLGIAFVALLVITLLAGMPRMALQDAVVARLRALREDEVRAVTITCSNGLAVEVRDGNSIAEFCGLLRNAHAFVERNDLPLLNLRVSINLGAEELEYQGSVPDRHPEDIAVRFPTRFGTGRILIPRAYRWLREQDKRHEETVE